MLNTAERYRYHVATLDFQPRCIGAKYGWLCAGGEKGQVASIRVGEMERHWKWLARSKREAEGTMAFQNDEEHEEWRRTQVEFDISPVRPETAEFGDQIMNSITLHNLENGRPDGSDVVLAVLTYIHHVHRLPANILKSC
jgi:hypothetical protein